MSTYHRQGAAFDTVEGVQKTAQYVWDTDTLSWVRWDGSVTGATGGGSVTFSPAVLSKRYDFASDTTLYIGEAVPGTLDSDALWRIKRITFDANGNPTNTLYAGGGLANQVWTGRTGLTYT